MDEYLPYVPSKQDTWVFLSTIPDLKQKAMATLMYSSDLRIGEVCSLRYEDVDRKNLRLHITHGKNRHAFGTHLYEDGVDLLTIKALMGHKSLNSTTIYVHLASNGTASAVSPFDRMAGVRHG